MDCSIIPTRFPNLYQISTTDFFFPNVEDPYIQGRLACANVLSDLYAEGVVTCDNLLMLMGVCDGMSPEQRDIVTIEMMKGFKDTATEAGTRVTGGQTVINGWPLVGGVAMSVVSKEEFIEPVHAVPGDVLVLTKPLGTQIAGNLHQWIDPLHPNHQKQWPRVSNFVTNEDAVTAYNKAIKSMIRLNKNGAILMHKYKAHAATDVTGFGLLGHADNLAKNQKHKVEFVINVLPIIKGMKAIDDVVNIWRLAAGFSAETSGGLLICLSSEEVAKEFCKEIEAIDGCPAWIIGTVVERKGEGSNLARLESSPTVIEV